jgi:hypothetical protein
MPAYLSKNSDLTNAERKYAQSEASEKISEASSMPREGLEEWGGIQRAPENCSPRGVELRFCKLSE